MASKKKSHEMAPTGFRRIETSISGFWKPEAGGECIQGVVGAPIDVKGADGMNRFFPLRLTSVDGGPVFSSEGKEMEMRQGMIVGIGGKMLAMFLIEREGREVFLVYRGKGKAKPGQSAPKMYDTFERDGDLGGDGDAA